MNIRDVAKKSGLSVVTVSRVLNNSPSVREGNRQKVLSAIEGYSGDVPLRILVLLGYRI